MSILIDPVFSILDMFFIALIVFVLSFKVYINRFNRYMTNHPITLDLTKHSVAIQVDFFDFLLGR